MNHRGALGGSSASEEGIAFRVGVDAQVVKEQEMIMRRKKLFGFLILSIPLIVAQSDALAQEEEEPSAAEESCTIKYYTGMTFSLGESMNPKYRALDTVANIFRILAKIAMVITGIVILFGLIAAFLSDSYVGGGLFGFLSELLGAVLGSLVFVIASGVFGYVLVILLLAVAESLQVIIDIEKNTRS